ncbi:MAG TPA: bifunctional DNA primase/polymerase [Streptosporangiaceae bacterium]|nr:bifunctional DNA primase/polymerase [Streptosporangiaceae bacterium]
MITDPEPMLSRALACARRGWRVFPCRSGGKEPATRHGFRDATTDLDQITSWWNRQPAANIAIATGMPGPDVLDVDQHGPAGHGMKACRQLKLAGLLDGWTAIVATPGRGLHFYFAGGGQSCGWLPRHHLDFRAAGGYVLVPPSQVGGRPYRLICTQSASGGLDWTSVTRLLDARPTSPSRAQSAGPGDARRLIAWAARLEEGNRNCGLFWAACRLIESGQEHLLGDLAAAASISGLPDREIARTITSARGTIARTQGPAAS